VFIHDALLLVACFSAPGAAIAVPNPAQAELTIHGATGSFRGPRNRRMDIHVELLDYHRVPASRIHQYAAFLVRAAPRTIGVGQVHSNRADVGRKSPQRKVNAAQELLVQLFGDLYAVTSDLHLHRDQPLLSPSTITTEPWIDKTVL
jgi:hypothetical protein